MKEQKKVCAYLDLLGFKYFISKDLEGAIHLLNNYHTILDLKSLSKKLRERRNPTGAHKDLEVLIERRGIDSLEYFLPFSDSIFIQSSEPDKLLPQLSSILLESFLLTSSAFQRPEDPDNPSKVAVKEFGIGETGKLTRSQTSKNWFPVLFRGGIAFGSCFSLEINSINNHEATKLPILVGRAVVEAVQLETRIRRKGPTLICSQSLYNILGDNINLNPA